MPKATLWTMDEQDETGATHNAHDALTTVAWSYSRRSAFEQCTRRYYYEYFGANKRLAKQEPAKDLLHRLKGVQNRHERTGAILHLAISAYLRRAQQGGTWDPSSLIRWAGGIFGADREYSSAHPEGDLVISGKYPPVLLLEYHDRLPNGDQLCGEAGERMAQALLSFTRDEVWRDFRIAGSSPGALIEHAIRLKGLPCRIDGKLDLAYPGDERSTLVDWKLGVSDGAGDDSLQLATYALWATEHFTCGPNELRVCKAHLSSGEVTDFRVDHGVLSAARARIIQDAERMVMLQEYGRSGIVAAFTPCLKPAVCALCSFRRVCLDA